MVTIDCMTSAGTAQAALVGAVLPVTPAR